MLTSSHVIIIVIDWLTALISVFEESKEKDTMVTMGTEIENLEVLFTDQGIVRIIIVLKIIILIVIIVKILLLLFWLLNLLLLFIGLHINWTLTHTSNILTEN